MKSNMEVLTKKFGDFLPTSILNNAFRKNDFDLLKTIRGCAIEIGYNLTYPLEQNNTEKMVLSQTIFHIVLESNFATKRYQIDLKMGTKLQYPRPCINNLK